ncbi:MAG: hypothetical protein WC205_11530 [Opitutaceae bacterium]|jgi:hypothetical protein
MTDPDFKKTLSTLTIPPVDPALRERGLHRALVALAQPQPADEAHSSARAGQPFWRASLAVLAVVFVAGLVIFREGREGSSAGQKVAHDDAVTLAQMQELFPGQLNAVIEHDGAVQLDLAHDAVPAVTSQPLIVQFESGGHRLRVLSYSGRSITLQLRGATLTFEVMVTGGGGIVLSGNDFVWSSTHPDLVAGYRVQASPLGSPL